MKHLIVFSFLFSICMLAPSAEGSYRIENIYLKTAYIEGETNVNKFYFIYENVIQHVINKLGQEQIEINIPVKEFKGDNPIMLSDFQSLLKSSEYPYVKVDLDKESLSDIAEGKTENLLLNFTIAGVKKEVRTNFRSLAVSENSKVLTGSAYLSLTDFSLEPPERFMGFIRVKDRVFIKFDIIFESSN